MSASNHAVDSAGSTSDLAGNRRESGRFKDEIAERSGRNGGSGGMDASRTSFGLFAVFLRAVRNVQTASVCVPNLSRPIGSIFDVETPGIDA